MGFTIAVYAAILGWFASRGVSRSAFLAVVGMGILVMTYNVVRIARARAALREPVRLEGFAAGQRRSHRVRGRVYLVGAPILIGVTWLGMLASSHSPMDAWAVLIACTLFLSAGWVRWFVALRRLA
jgi:hypothetical protein